MLLLGQGALLPRTVSSSLVSQSSDVRYPVDAAHATDNLTDIAQISGFESQANPSGLGSNAAAPLSPPLTPVHSGEGYVTEVTTLPRGEGPIYDPRFPTAMPPDVGSLGSPLASGQPADTPLPDWAAGEWERGMGRVMTGGAAAAGAANPPEPSGSGAAALVGGASEYSPTLPQAPPSYSPNRSSKTLLDVPTPMPDLSPLVQMPGDPASYAPVGTYAWQGRFHGPGMVPFRMKCETVAGMASLSKMLSTEEIEIKGRVGLDKVEAFLEQLRGSQNRTVTLGILKLADDAGLMDQTSINELIKHYSRKGRTGVVAPSPNLEGYLIAKSDLAARLLLTARQVVEPDQGPLIPVNVNPSGELLLVMIHKKTWTPPVENAEKASDWMKSSAPVFEADTGLPQLATPQTNPEGGDVMEW